MNISPFLIYVWQLADNVRYAVEWTLPFSLVVSSILTIAMMVAISDGEKVIAAILKKISVSGWIVTISCILMIVFVPSSNTIAMMVVIPKIADSKVVQQDIPDLYDAAIKALKHQIEPKP